MATKKPLAWWVLPGVIAASVTALGAIGTVMVKGAAYITLPEKVEAGERKNSEQDEALNKLTAIQETWQQIYQQQQQAPNRPPSQRQEWQDPETGLWWCCPTHQDCEQDRYWERC